jgi:DNA sulfur modification protein DndC
VTTDMQARRGPKQPTLFDGARLTLDDAVELTTAMLRDYAQQYRHWVLTFSGGKDSSATLTIVLHLIRSGRVPHPETVTVLMSDTRMELLPLHHAAMGLLDYVRREHGVDVRIVLPELDHRWWVYMLGRGVPPSGARFRWCVGLLKLNPMWQEQQRLKDEFGEDLLILTGVRLGESAARDQRIAISCSRDGTECSQGYFQRDTPKNLGAILAPIVHWRVCHVWDWLSFFAPAEGFPTQTVADAYGGDEAEEINARTGCTGCPVASKDLALNTVVSRYPETWGYLSPLRELRVLYATLRRKEHRLRQPGGERNADGSLASKQHRMGPLKMASRLWALEVVLDIQRRISAEADRLGRPRVDLINREEEARIRGLIAANTWPRKWTGSEPAADDFYVADGELFLGEDIGPAGLEPATSGV